MTTDISETTLVEISQFFDRYHQLENELTIQFEADFARLKDGYIPIFQQVLEEVRLTAPEYNVFSILGLEREEVHTHSAMLENLLNPKGSHGQQHLFLCSFLEYCAFAHKDFPIPSEDIADGRWHVKSEEYTSYGILDILIQSPDLNSQYVIENKIDAPEEGTQLFRYGKWMESQKDEYSNQALVLLTIDGDESVSAKGIPYYSISYRRDISTWLRSTLHEIKASNVREVVSQYLSLIENL